MAIDTIDDLEPGYSVRAKLNQIIEAVNAPSPPFALTVEDEGVAMTVQPVINFVGAGVAVTNGTGEVVVTIPGGPAGSVEELAAVAPITLDITDPAVPIIAINPATTSTAGSLSAADKIKLNALSGTNTGDVTNSNLGAGETLLGAVNGTFKTLVAGANVTLTAATNTITIAATGGGGGGTVDSVFGRTDVVVAAQSDYATYYLPFLPGFNFTGPVVIFQIGHSNAQGLQAYIAPADIDTYTNVFAIQPDDGTALGTTLEMVEWDQLRAHSTAAAAYVIGPLGTTDVAAGGAMTGPLAGYGRGNSAEGLAAYLNSTFGVDVVIYSLTKSGSTKTDLESGGIFRTRMASDFASVLSLINTAYPDADITAPHILMIDHGGNDYPGETPAAYATAASDYIDYVEGLFGSQPLIIIPDNPDEVKAARGYWPAYERILKMHSNARLVNCSGLGTFDSAVHWLGSSELEIGARAGQSISGYNPAFNFPSAIEASGVSFRYGGFASDVIDSSSAIGFDFNTTNVLNDAGSKTLRVRNGTVEKMSAGTAGWVFVSDVTDGASAVGYTFDTEGALDDSTASLLKLNKNGTTKLNWLNSGPIFTSDKPNGTATGAFIFDTSVNHTTLTNLFEIKNNSVNKFVVTSNGSFISGPLGSPYFATHFADSPLTYMLEPILYSSAVVSFTTQITDGAAVIGFNYNTPAYTTTAKLAEWKNNGTAKVSFRQDGLITAAGGLTIAGAITGATTGAFSGAVSMAALTATTGNFSGAVTLGAGGSLTGTLSGTGEISTSGVITTSGSITGGSLRSTGGFTLDTGVYTSGVADGAGNMAHKFVSPIYANATAKLAAFYNNTTEKLSVDLNGVIQAGTGQAAVAIRSNLGSANAWTLYEAIGIGIFTWPGTGGFNLSSGAADGTDAFTMAASVSHATGDLFCVKNVTTKKFRLSGNGAPGFWGLAPIGTQPTATSGGTGGFVANTSANTMFKESTNTGGTGSTAYTFADVVYALKVAGLIAT